MKILFHLNSMGRGGAERVVSILSREFAEQGHQVIVTTQWFSEREYVLDPKVRRISVGLNEHDENKNRIQKAFCRLFRLRNCILKEKPDLVISFCCKANFRSAFSLTGMKIPLIVSVRNNPVEDYENHKLATAWMEHKASGCVFQTPDAKAYFSGKLRNKSEIIFNPVADTYLTPGIEDTLQASDRQKEIVSVGRITEQKNQLLLLQAFAKIKEKYPDYIVKIYGEIEDETIYDRLQSFIRENGMEKQVYFMGTTDSVRNEIARASLFVLSSDYEGMPNALMEALVTGVPSISTDCPCGGSRMLIQDKVSGLLTPVGDADALARSMDEMLRDRERAHRMGREGRKLRSKVDPDRICQEWMAYIKKVVQ